MAATGVGSIAALFCEGAGCTSGTGSGALGLFDAVGTEAGGAVGLGAPDNGADGAGRPPLLGGAASATNCFVITCPACPSGAAWPLFTDTYTAPASPTRSWIPRRAFN